MSRRNGTKRYWRDILDCIIRISFACTTDQHRSLVCRENLAAPMHCRNLPFATSTVCGLDTLPLLLVWQGPMKGRTRPISVEPNTLAYARPSLYFGTPIRRGENESREMTPAARRTYRIAVPQSLASWTTLEARLRCRFGTSRTKLFQVGRREYSNVGCDSHYGGTC